MNDKLKNNLITLLGVYKGGHVYDRIMSQDKGNRENHVLENYENSEIKGNMIVITSTDGYTIGVAIEESEGGTIKVGDIVC